MTLFKSRAILFQKHCILIGEKFKASHRLIEFGMLVRDKSGSATELVELPDSGPTLTETTSYSHAKSSMTIAWRFLTVVLIGIYNIVFWLLNKADMWWFSKMFLEMNFPLAELKI